jgi:3-oxoacyl-[acyl-carrier protein] reductase
MSTLSGKVAIVTGASQGIGAAIALRLAADGARVVINYSRNAERADAVVHSIRAVGGQAIAVQADFTQPARIGSLIDAAVEAYGKLDILVNNAGIYEGDTLDTITVDSFDRHFHLNVRALLLLTQAAARVMQPGAVVVNISSGLARSPYPMMHVYCATKGAVDTLTRSLALELGPRQIRVVGIAPGFTKTEGNTESAAGMDNFFIGKTPLGRVGQPDDIAAAVAFAVSADAGWVTGSTLDVAGGMVF